MRPLFLCALLAAGCGEIPQFLYPIYTADDLVFAEELIGTWQSDAETWTFERSGDKSYTCRVRSDEGDGQFTAHLARIDTALYLDISSEAPKALEGTFLIPGHYFMRLHTPDIRADRPLRLLLPGAELDGVLKDDPAALRHQRPDGRLVITAPTAELQAFFRGSPLPPDLYIELQRANGPSDSPDE